MRFVASPLMLTDAHNIGWIAAYLLFGPVLWVGASVRRIYEHFGYQLLLIAVAAISTLLMMYLRPNCYAGALVVVVAWQASLLWRRSWTLALIAVQTVAIFIIYAWASAERFGWSIAVIYFAYQIYALAIADIAKREGAARQELARRNLELKTTQRLLAESSRIGERVRISREMHDVLGHDLTALTLHLEVALNSQTNREEEVRSAQALAKGLLGKVREVVSFMRTDEPSSLARLLSNLVVDGPSLKVHLAMSGDLDATDMGRAHTLIRCLQEVITNARKHSGASNLWLDVKREAGNVVAEACDDGHGPKAGGLDPASADRGHGFNVMRERLGEFGGTLKIDDGDGQGFGLRIDLPLSATLP
ncbi:MAG: histidine kinase [Steroidobacteraceae bacterium]